MTAVRVLAMRCAGRPFLSCSDGSEGGGGAKSALPPRCADNVPVLVAIKALLALCAILQTPVVTSVESTRCHCLRLALTPRVGGSIPSLATF
jgi:hypothetical protein